AFIGHEDRMKRLIDLCHKGGMDVILYYSLIFNNYAYEEHPAWRMRDTKGRGSRDIGGRYGMCCPNNLEYRQLVKAQIGEICDYFEFDGMFFDMTFWPFVCYCDSCRSRWMRKARGQLPTVIDWRDENWLTFHRKRYEWIGDFAQFVTGEVKRHKPDCSVQH